jgi:hypothetical protein
MDQAKSVLSTPPTNTSAASRRSFLVQAAGAAAGGATLGVSLPLPTLPAAAAAQSSNAEADPIFAAIEAHRRAIAAHNDAVCAESALEQSLPRDRRRSRITASEENIVENDDPRWLDAIRVRWVAANTMDDLAIDLLNVMPTTTGGVEALLRYFAHQEEALFPDEGTDDDESIWAFGALLVRHAADALRAIAPAELSEFAVLQR